MGGGKQAAGSVASATIYTAGRVTTNALAWTQSLAAMAIQVAAMKWLMDKQTSQYDKISKKQISYLEEAVDQFMVMLENQIVPMMQDAYPDVPQAAEYTPVDPELLAYNTFVSNLKNQEKGYEMIAAMNNTARLNYRARLYLLSPLAVECVNLEGVQIKAMMQGKASNDDIMEIFESVDDNALATGRIGNMGRQTAAALGVTRMRLQAAGREALHAHLAGLNANVAPIAAEARLEDYFLKPQNVLGFAIQQMELIQQSTQNLYNTKAQKPPYRMGIIKAKMNAMMAQLQLLANRGNLVNQFVPNTAAVFGPMIQNFLSQFQDQTRVDRAAEWAHPAGPEQAPVGDI